MRVVHPMTCHPPTAIRWPVRAGGLTGRVGSFGKTRKNSDGSFRFHRGVDWLCEPGSPIWSAHEGKVIRAGEQADGKGYGQRIYLRTGEGQGIVLTIYAHLSGQNVAVNEMVRAGHLLGWTGRSGMDKEPDHIHHEVRLGGEGKDDAIDPEWWYHEEVLK